MFENHKKVSFSNMASEANYVNNFSEQKRVNFGEFLKKSCGQTVLPDRSIMKRQKLVENTVFEFVNIGIFLQFCPITTDLSGNAV